MSGLISSVLIGVYLLVAVPSPAYAYLDPVTGSFILQGLIAGVVALLAAVRSVRERIMNFFRQKGTAK